MSNKYSPAEIRGMELWEQLNKQTPQRKYVEDLLAIIERDIGRKLKASGYNPSGSLYPLQPGKKTPRHVGQLRHALIRLREVRHSLDSENPEIAVATMFHVTRIAAEAGINFKRTAYLKNAVDGRSRERKTRNKRIRELYDQLRNVNPYQSWGQEAFYAEIEKRLLVEGYEQSSPRTIRRVLQTKH